MYRKSLVLLIFVITLGFIITSGCEETSIDFDGFNQNQLSVLLTSPDSFKIWQRQSLRIDGEDQNISGCQLNHQLIFEVTEANDSLLTHRIAGSPSCNELVLFSGSWTVGAGREVDTLFFIANDGAFQRFITDITSQNMNLYYVENEQLIAEEYTAIDE